VQWTVYASLFDGLSGPVNASVNAMAIVLQAWVAPWLKQGLLFAVPARMLWAAFKRDADPFSETMLWGISGGLAIYFASTMAGYGPLFRDTLLNGIASDVGGRLAHDTRPLNGAMFDQVWIRAWLGGMQVYKALPWTIGGIGLMICVVAFWFVAIIGVTVAFVVWLSAYLMAALLVGIGPLFAGLFVFPWFRHIFWGWLNTALTSVVLQILCTALLSLLLGSMTRLLATLVVLERNGDQITQLQMLFGGVVLFVGCGWLAQQLPGVAASITHGFAGYGQVPRLPDRKDGERKDPDPKDPNDKNPNNPQQAGSSAPVTRNAPAGRSVAA
jgi:type IV secretion system protein VirB6